MSELEQLFIQQAKEKKRGDRTFTLQSPPYQNGAHVYRSTSQQITSGTTGAVITFDSVRYNYGDEGLMWNAGTPTILTCVVPGVYNIYGAIAWQIYTGGYRTAQIRYNTATIIAFDTRAPITLVNVVSLPYCHYYLAVGDTIELWGIHNAAVDLNALHVDNYSVEFAAWRMV